MNRKQFYADLVERTAWTFAQGALAVWIVTSEFSGHALKVAAAAGVIAAVKSFLANRLPWTADDSASSLPARYDPPKGKAAGTYTVKVVADTSELKRQLQELQDDVRLRRH